MRLQLKGYRFRHDILQQTSPIFSAHNLHSNAKNTLLTYVQLGYSRIVIARFGLSCTAIWSQAAPVRQNVMMRPPMMTRAPPNRIGNPGGFLKTRKLMTCQTTKSVAM